MRLALLIALAGGLVAREPHRGLGRLKYLGEISRIFKGYTPVTGHANCQLRLTESGMYWKRAESPDAATETSDTDEISPSPGTYIHHQHNVVIGDHNRVGNVSSSYEQHVVQPPDIGQLAEDLAKLRGVLTWQPSGPEYALAISYLASALRAAERGDESGTMKQLSRMRTLSVEVGKWLLSTATAVGIPVLTMVLEQVLHLPPKK